MRTWLGMQQRSLRLTLVFLDASEREAEELVVQGVVLPLLLHANENGSRRKIVVAPLLQASTLRVTVGTAKAGKLRGTRVLHWRTLGAPAPSALEGGCVM